MSDAAVDVDLDALRRAHADGKRTKTFRAAGHTYNVPSKLPIYVAVLLAEGELRKALRLWLGDEQEEQFATEVNPDDEDVKLLFQQLYQADSGESAASVES